MSFAESLLRSYFIWPPPERALLATRFRREKQGGASLRNETAMPAGTPQGNVILNSPKSDQSASNPDSKQDRIFRIVEITIICATFIFSAVTHWRTQTLFVGEDVPRVQAKPLGIGEHGTTHNSTLNFLIVNHSGFDALNIDIDVKYCTDNKKHRRWVSEWVKADQESKNKGKIQGVVLDTIYPFAPSMGPKLRGYSSITTQELGCGLQADALHLETEVCDKGKLGLPILVRTRWMNEKQRSFDEIQKYRLICTKNWMGQEKNPKGRSFTMVPDTGNSCD